MESAKKKQVLETTLINGSGPCAFTDSRLIDDTKVFTVGNNPFRVVDALNLSDVMINLNQVRSPNPEVIERLIRLTEKVEAVNGRLVLVNASDVLQHALRAAVSNGTLLVAPSAADAYSMFGVAPVAESDDEPVQGVLTEEEIEEIKACGLSLSDVIRAIETING